MPYLTSPPKSTMSSQYSVPNSTIGMRLRIFLVCTSVRIYQCQDFEQFVERAETAREQHDRLGEIDEPELPHKEIMKVEVQLPADIRVVELLIRYRDREPDIDAPCFRGARVSRLHDAGTAAGADDEAPVLAAQILRPFGQPPRQFARCLIVGREPQRRLRRLYPLSSCLRLGERRHRGRFR